jgi:acyl-coenzyme A synthetase/AMP-(fatty) acid ligase
MFEGSIRYRSQYEPDGVAFETSQGAITYHQFESAITCLTSALQAWGLDAGDRVLVSDSRPFIHWSLLFALERLGCISISDDAQGHAMRVACPDAVLAETVSNIPQATRALHTSADWIQLALSDTPRPQNRRTRSPDDPVRIVLSSGSTGLPKPIQLTRGQIDTRILHILCSHLPLRSRMLSTMGINAAGGYVASMAVWMSGGTMMYGAADTAEAVVSLKPTFMLMAPIQLQYLLAALPSDFVRRSDLTIALGGSATPRRLAEEARRRLTPNLIFAYGSTEAGLTSIGPADLVDQRPGAAGYLLPWAELQIVDEDGMALPPGEIGRVRVRTDEMVSAYADSSDGEFGDGSFRDGWFYPGDVGSMSAEGLFVLEGREDDVLNLGGVKISAWSIEEALAADPSVVESAAFSLPDQSGLNHLYAAVVLAPGTDPGDLARSLGARMTRPLKLLPVEKLPRNQMGKVQRFQIREAAMDRLRAAPST